MLTGANHWYKITVRAMPRRSDYLILRGAKYSFRYAVPEPLRGIIGKREFKEALSESDYETARKKAARLRVKADAEIKAAWSVLNAVGQQSPRWASSVSDDELGRLTSRWFVAREREAEALTARDVDVDQRLEEIGYLVDVGDGTSALASIHAAARDLLREECIDLDPSSPPFARLVGLIHEAMIEHEKRVVARFSERPVQLNPRLAGLSAETALAEKGRASVIDIRGHAETHSTRSTPLSEIVGRWAAERKRSGKALDTYQAVARWFDERTGNLPVEKITKLDVIAFKDKLLQEGQSAANVKVKLSRLRTLLAYAEQNAVIATNPGAGINVLVPDADRRKRRPYELEGLAALFSSPVYAIDERPTEGRGEAAYWIPLLGLYTGARIEELCQLRIGDVRPIAYPDDDDQMRSSWFFCLPGFKNANAERRVPVHPNLEALGFLKFVAAVSRDPNSWVFDGLRTNKYGKRAPKWGEWFSEYLRNVCGVTDRRVTFHSLRHTFKRYSRHMRIEEGVQRVIMGHAPRDVPDEYGDHTLFLLVEGMKSYRIPGFQLPAPPPGLRD